MTLTPITQSQSLSVFSQIRPPEPTPALLNTQCGAPKRRRRCKYLDLIMFRYINALGQHLNARRRDLGGRGIQRACSTSAITML